ncbi:MAG: hypothetical protein NT051_07050 [Candidatus Micrarchaeota archaeon]|nr:hypothetical protein [Candidatus Micrarchaeota archaeon]
MGTTLTPDELVMPILLIKAVLALLSVILFLNYWFYWEKAKKGMPIHFFYTKWRAVRHAIALGFASVGFAIGFSLELFGQQLGLGATSARFASSIFEVGSLFCMLYVFFELSLEDVPHFSHIIESMKFHKGIHGSHEFAKREKMEPAKKSRARKMKKR